jgi:hypothetical protein
VTLKGTRDILTAKGTRSVSHAHVRVTIHAPIDASEYAKAGLKEGREALMTAVRDALESGL